MCKLCLHKDVKSNGVLKCGMCREPITTAIPLQVAVNIAELAQRIKKRVGPNPEGMEPDDVRRRYEVDCIIGLRAVSTVSAEYKVVWKSDQPNRQGKVETSWEPRTVFDNPVVLEEFHRRHNLVSLGSVDFVFPVLIEEAVPKVFTKASESGGKMVREFKCGACNYKSKRKSNLLTHQQTQHIKSQHTQTRIPCPFPGCSSTFGLVGAMTKHFKKAHASSNGMHD